MLGLFIHLALRFKSFLLFRKKKCRAEGRDSVTRRHCRTSSIFPPKNSKTLWPQLKRVDTHNIFTVSVLRAIVRRFMPRFVNNGHLPPPPHRLPPPDSRTLRLPPVPLTEAAPILMRKRPPSMVKAVARVWPFSPSLPLTPFGCSIIIIKYVQKEAAHRNSSSSSSFFFRWLFTTRNSLPRP